MNQFRGSAIASDGGLLAIVTAAVSDETDDEGRGVPGMKQSHEFRTREASNPNDWLRTRLVAPEFHCGVPR